MYQNIMNFYSIRKVFKYQNPDLQQSYIICDTTILTKGQCREIVGPRFYSFKHPCWARGPPPRVENHVTPSLWTELGNTKSINESNYKQTSHIKFCPVSNYRIFQIVSWHLRQSFFCARTKGISRVLRTQKTTCTHSLKGQWHEIFDPRFFSSINPI
jgi:hypothetical protein